MPSENNAYTQLIARSAADPLLKTGLLILDSKAELLPSVRRAAQAAGRPHDVVVLGPEGNACYDLFGPLKSFEDVETVTQRFLLAVPPLGSDNAYWQTATTTMVAAALSLLVASQPVVTFDFALQFLRAWFTSPHGPLPELVQEVAARARQQLPSPGKGTKAAPNHQLQSALDQVGERVRQALAQHFNTLVFLRSREPETGWLAEHALGLREEQGPRPPRDTAPTRMLAFAPMRQERRRVPVCPLGSLYRLAAHQGYVLCRDGHCTEFPVWFAPWFETAPDPPQMPEASIAVQLCLVGPDHLRGLMAREGHRAVCPSEVVQAAFDLCRPKERKGRLLARVARFFRTRTDSVPAGLENLPRCWLAVLSCFSRRRPTEPPFHQRPCLPGRHAPRALCPGTCVPGRGDGPRGSHPRGNQRLPLSHGLAAAPAPASRRHLADPPRSARRPRRSGHGLMKPDMIRIEHDPRLDAVCISWRDLGTPFFKEKVRLTTQIPLYLGSVCLGNEDQKQALSVAAVLATRQGEPDRRLGAGIVVPPTGAEQQSIFDSMLKAVDLALREGLVDAGAADRARQEIRSMGAISD
jgi:hypothetical protein